MRGPGSLVLMILLTMGLSGVTANTAWADPEARTLGWVIAREGEFGSDCSSGPFHDNVTGAQNGDTIQLWGCGSLATKDKTADGGGRFVYTTSTGGTFEGDWSALGLLRYQSYGGSEEFAGLIFEGGVATLAVTLTPDGGGPGLDAVLQVYCHLGDPPPNLVEGFRLSIRGGPNFNEPLSGETGFFTS